MFSFHLIFFQTDMNKKLFQLLLIIITVHYISYQNYILSEIERKQIYSTKFVRESNLRAVYKITPPIEHKGFTYKNASD